jgi:hypothetical protein
MKGSGIEWGPVVELHDWWCWRAAFCYFSLIIIIIITTKIKAVPVPN